tara:strand:+ start:718 stop:1449 length:732 start_codon:yes stop_codon:yes gene_type:complete
MDQKIRISPGKPKKKIKKKVYLIGTFLFILSLLFFFAFEGGSITGNAIRNGEILSGENSFQIKAQLDGLNRELSLNQEISEIVLEIENSQEKLFFGENSFNLSTQKRTEVKIQGFKGKVSFDGEKLANLKGKATKLIINDLPLSSISKDSNIFIEGELKYKLITLKEISLKEYNELKSGTVEIDGDKLKMELTNESIVIEKFYGDLTNGLTTNIFGIRRPHLTLRGFAKDVEVNRKFRASSLN